MGMKYGLSCHFCLCEVCTRMHCREIRSRYRVGFCTAMIMRERCPKVKCDFFQHRQKHKVYRVVRRRRKTDILLERLEAIEKGIDKLSGKL